MNFDIEEVKEFIKNSSESSSIYIGADSQRFKKKVGKERKWYARYSTVVIIHHDSCKGAKVFGKIDVEPDFEQNLSKPFTRMWNEMIRASDIVKELEEVIGNRRIEIHLDINPNKDHGSNVAYQAAKGYIMSMHGFEPKFKPAADSFAASCAADRMGML